MAKRERASDKIMRLEAQRDELLEALAAAKFAFSFATLGSRNNPSRIKLLDQWEALINRIEGSK